MNKIIKTELGRIEYRKVGIGQPIIFIHGGHSNCNETLFQKGYDKNQYQLITPSRPGYGKTPLDNKLQPNEAAELIKSMIEEMKIGKIIIVGISAGGLTALQLASELQGRVVKLILISAVTKKWLNSKDELYKKGKRLFAPSKEKLTWSIYRLFFRLFPGMMSKVLFNEISSKKGERITKEEIQEIKEMTFKQKSGEGFVTDLEQDINDEVLRIIDCPTLIMHSKNDKAVKLEMAKHAKENIKNSELKIYDNKWGHLLWIGEDSRIPIFDVMEFIKK